MQRHDLPVSRRGDLTDEQWERIYPYLPVGRKGRSFNNVRDTFLFKEMLPMTKQTLSVTEMFSSIMELLEQAGYAKHTL